MNTIGQCGCQVKPPKLDFNLLVWFGTWFGGRPGLVNKGNCDDRFLTTTITQTISGFGSTWAYTYKPWVNAIPTRSGIFTSRDYFITPDVTKQYKYTPSEVFTSYAYHPISNTQDSLTFHSNVNGTVTTTRVLSNPVKFSVPSTAQLAMFNAHHMADLVAQAMSMTPIPYIMRYLTDGSGNAGPATLGLPSGYGPSVIQSGVPGPNRDTDAQTNLWLGCPDALVQYITPSRTDPFGWQDYAEWDYGGPGDSNNTLPDLQVQAYNPLLAWTRSVLWAGNGWNNDKGFVLTAGQPFRFKTGVAAYCSGGGGAIACKDYVPRAGDQLDVTAMNGDGTPAEGEYVWVEPGACP